MSHWLNRMLSPSSVAIVGASEREGSIASATVLQLVDTEFAGELLLVNPKYKTLFGRDCFESLSMLPMAPDLVVFVISGLVLERSFNEAISIGVGGIVIYASNYVEEGQTMPLPERLRERAIAAGIPVCGGNSMGFYNYDSNVMISFDRPPPSRPAGHIGLIAHSGSAMTYLANNDARFCYNYVISSGQETNASAADYMDFLLEQPSTRVIALFIETVRDVSRFVAALKKAQQHDIPVVITKLGRTAKSARLALSHSGAIAGDHAAFSAVCKRYGAILANDIDELITTAMLFSNAARVTAGGVSSLLDSGGMREQMIDLAKQHGVCFADVSEFTLASMQKHLEFGLHADNPLDGMGALGRNTGQTYLECGKALLDDPNTGLLTYEFEFRNDFSHYPVMFDIIEELNGYSGKPLIVINSCAYSDIGNIAASLSQKGIPVINGIDVALRAIRNFCSFRTGINSESEPSKPQFDGRHIEKWRSKFSSHTILDEATSLALLKDFDFHVSRYAVVENLPDAKSSATQLGFPLAMKTAAAGIDHKSDSGGVILSIKNARDLEIAYSDLQSRLGHSVLLMPMAETGVELGLGMKNDPLYGPIIIVAAGGLLIELIEDRSFAAAPLNRTQALEMLNELKVTTLLQGVRGQSACDVESFIDLVVRFSYLVVKFADQIAEIDLNPVIVSPAGCKIVDALIVIAGDAVVDH